MVSWPELIWAAVSVGVSPTIPLMPGRPLAEMGWRALMTAASLEEDGGRFHKSMGYRRLDPSEKSAVSYFLGMAQAKVTCARLLDIPHLAHLDSVLAAAGLTTRRSRPDFIGFDLTTSTNSAAVEAKGRTHGWTTDLVARAKGQAAALPSIIGRPNTIEVASVAWFETDFSWHAHLEDPPRRAESETVVSQEEVLHGYYAPLVRAVISGESITPDLEADGSATTLGDMAMTTVAVPDCDMTVGLPTALVEAVQPALVVAGGGQVSDQKVATLSAELLPLATQIRQVVALSDEAAMADSARAFVGGDGLYVALGESWVR